MCQTAAGTGASPPAAASALGDTVQQRLERILGYGGVTVPMRAIDPASLQVQAALDVGGQASGASVANIVQSDNGWLFTDNVGVICYRDRPHLNADTAIWDIGMNVPGGYIPFAGDVAARNDPTRVFPDVTITPYAPDGSTPAELVPSNAAAVAAAQAQYTPQSLAVTSYLQSTTEMQSAVNWLFGYYGTLRKGIETITIDAASHPAAWGLVLGINISDLIQVYDAPFGSPATTTTYRVSSIARTLSFGANGQGITGQVQIAADPVPPSGYWS